MIIRISGRGEVGVVAMAATVTGKIDVALIIVIIPPGLCESAAVN